jgi:basic membrane lipoprotein Med (substrate-binding protein (PBP1-ABC) superfamily)
MPAGGHRGAGRAQRKRGRRRWWRAVGSATWPPAAVLRDWWRSLARSQRWLVGGGGTALVVLVAVAAVWASQSGSPAPRVRRYLAYTACLLTDSHGIAAAQAAQVWAGMQDASLATHAKVAYLPVMSGSTAAAADPYLSSLLQRHCAVVVATGTAQVAAVTAQAGRFPSVRFVVIGRVAARSHVTAVEGPASRLRANVAGLITAAMHDST